MAADQWNGFPDAGARQRLEREILPAYLPRCRWFAGKSRSLAQVRILDEIAAPDSRDWLVCLLRVEYAQGASETYLLPLAQASSAAACAEIRAEFPQAIVDDSAEGGVLYDAFHHAGFRSRVLELIAKGDVWTGKGMLKDGASKSGELKSGALRGRPAGNGFPGGAPGAEEASKVLKAEQSNTAVLWPGRYFVKFLRRLEPGENPEAEILRFLAARGFPNVPRFHGSLEYVSSDGEAWTVAIAEGLVAHAGDAWTHALSLANGYLDRLAAEAADLGPLPDSGLPRGADALDFARLLGRRTAEMHLALASRPDLPAFAPEPFTPALQAVLAQGMSGLAETVLALLETVLPRLPERTAAQGRAILAERGRILAAFAGLKDRPIPSLSIRVHGDYHLGQVLHTGGDVVILDFEGEPARPLAERRMKRPPWKDVAGMLRSFHYAVHSAWSDRKSVVTNMTMEQRRGLEPWVELWPQRAGGAFLEAYLAAAGDAAFVPGDADRKALLTAYLMEKAVYELAYELNNRPDWAHIPMAGILGLL
jgi:maltose alpha-D-glucosyltransferase/alpha-amylase